jgi:serine/threonine protein kinase
VHWPALPAMKACPVCQNAYPADQTICPSDGVRLEEVGGSAARICTGYEVIRLAGRGQLCDVYKAVRTASNQTYALKVLKAEWMEDPALVRNLKEAAFRSREFVHPYAARIEGLEQADGGRPVIVAEYVDGLTLRDLLAREGRLPVDRACSIAWQVASVLSALHEVGVVHQAIKPDSVMVITSPAGQLGSFEATEARRLSGSGERQPGDGANPAVGRARIGDGVKVLNCGLGAVAEARRRDIGHLSLKDGGNLVGDPRYFSPEQAVGKTASELDGRSDLYSLGLLLYEMLSGALPFPGGPPMETLLAHLLNLPRPLRAATSTVPEELNDLVLRLLAKNPASRPATASAVMEELERWAGLGASEPSMAASGEVASLTVAEEAEACSPASFSERTPPVPSPVAAFGDQGEKRLAPASPSRGSPPGEAGLSVDDFPLAPVRAAVAGATPASQVRRGTETRVPGSILALNQSGPPVATETVGVREYKWINRIAWSMVAIAAAATGWYYRGPLSSAAGQAWNNIAPLGKAKPAASGGSPSAMPAANHATSSPGTGLWSEGPSDLTSPSGSQAPSLGPAATAGQASGLESSRASQAAGGLGRGAVTPTASPEGERKSSAESVAEADRLFQAGEYDQAISLYQAALAADPNNEVLRRKIARARSAKAAEAKYLGDQ